MLPTTPHAIRADLVSTIRAIDPSYPYGQDDRWAPVDRPEEVAGKRPRLFYVQINVGQPDLEVYGDGMTLEAEMFVYTSYVGVPPHELDAMIPMDGHQLYLAIERRTSPALEGFYPPQYLGWAEESDDEGHVYGSHRFLIRYLATATL